MTLPKCDNLIRSQTTILLLLSPGMRIVSLESTTTIMCAAAKVPCVEFFFFFFSDSSLKYAISRQEYRENLQKSSQICYFRTDIGGSFPGPVMKSSENEDEDAELFPSKLEFSLNGTPIAMA